MKEKLQAIKEKALDRIANSENLDALNEIRVAYLGKKGELTAHETLVPTIISKLRLQHEIHHTTEPGSAYSRWQDLSDGNLYNYYVFSQPLYLNL